MGEYAIWWLSKFSVDRKKLGGPLLPHRSPYITKCECCGRPCETALNLNKETYCSSCYSTEVKWYTHCDEHEFNVLDFVSGQNDLVTIFGD